MRVSLRKGFYFGLTSGIITTLGLIVGLNSSTHSSLVVVGGILVIAIADALSDALGMHISEESENRHTVRQIWDSTFATFFAKFFFAITFVIPFLLWSLFTAIIVSIIWGLFLLGVFSYLVAKNEKMPPHKVILEHLVIAVLVIIVTHYVGFFVSLWFG